MKNKKEKLQKINSQINNENQIIANAKIKIKKLNSQKRKLILQIQNEEFAELKETLADYGIKTKADFQKFLQKNENVDFLKSEPTENETQWYNS
ncbi:MAG: hypothetical protein Q4A46_04555 [Clostridia bacterium]|nr:hypothetical protein [Clostridia bacterium]